MRTKVHEAQARLTDPETSFLAAQTASQRLTETQERVKAVLIRGPFTDEEIEQAYRDYWPDSKVTAQSLRSRRSELVRLHLVRFDGTYGTTTNGQRTRKWRLA